MALDRVKYRMHTFWRRLFYSLWYYFKPPWDTGISPPELIAFLQSHSPGRALDLGCGTGTNIITLARHGWEATGVDFASPAIQRAKEKARRARVRVDLRVADVASLPGIEGPFDLVLDIGCFHSLPSGRRARYVQNLAHLLAPAGTYLLYAFFRPLTENGPGLQEDDLALLSRVLDLIHRVDGSERGLRPSAWLTYRKPIA